MKLLERRRALMMCQGKSKNLFDFQQINGCVGNDLKPISSAPAYYILDKDNEIFTSNMGTYVTNIYFNYPITLQAGTYTFSAQLMADKDSGHKVCVMGARRIQDNKLVSIKNIYPTLSSYRTWERHSITFTLTGETVVYFMCQGDSTSSDYRQLNIKFKELQLEEGSVATDYEPYQ